MGEPYYVLLEILVAYLLRVIGDSCEYATTSEIVVC